MFGVKSVVIHSAFKTVPLRRKVFGIADYFLTAVDCGREIFRRVIKSVILRRRRNSESRAKNDEISVVNVDKLRSVNGIKRFNIAVFAGCYDCVVIFLNKAEDFFFFLKFSLPAAGKRNNERKNQNKNSNSFHKNYLRNLTIDFFLHYVNCWIEKAIKRYNIFNGVYGKKRSTPCGVLLNITSILIICF